MNIRIEKRNEILASREVVKSLAATTGLNEKLVELLVLREISDVDSINKFLYPSADNLCNPFLMKGMQETVERINEAISNDEKVVVYGDYDADGVCAAAILALYLASRNLSVFVHIPNRMGEGYGLNVESLARIIENEAPDLILTCDCGISGINEVEFVQELGVDIIVTDHHEISGNVPNCVVVNPKQSECLYPDKMLCGAGVALKVIEALAGREEALQYVDLACIATIADLVPLTNENRLIVQLGLKRLNERRNLGLNLLFDSLELKNVSSSDVAYKVAPRINAAGRMGDAYRAFELLTSTNVSQIRKIIDEISEDNDRRKKLCDEIYSEAEGDLVFEDLSNDRAIILSHPNWEKGITGIVAARIAGDYNRPAFILVRSADDVYKGTCRSVDGISVHDLLLYCRDLLIEFGGHSQAAGFSIVEANIPTFKRRVNEYLSRFNDEYFLPKATYDMDVQLSEISYDFVSSLSLLEPTGNGNPKPLFRLSIDNVKLAPCKSSNSHISLTFNNGLQIFAFNYSKLSYQLLGDGIKTIVTELQLSTYGGKQVKGIMRCCSPENLYVNELIVDAYPYELLRYLPADNPKYYTYMPQELDALTSKMYGTLIIATNYDAYQEYYVRHNHHVFHEFVNPTTKNNFTRVIVAPDLENENLSLALYENIVFLSPPLSDGVISFLNSKTNARIYVPKISNQSLMLCCDREMFANYFEAIKANQNVTAASLNGFFKTIAKTNDNLDYKQFVFCVRVFEELGIISLHKSPFQLIINRGIKAELSKSQLYSYVKGRLNES